MSKVSFLFLTADNIHHPKIWENYLKGQTTNYSLYVHPKNKEKITQSILKPHIIKNTVPTFRKPGEESTFSITRAMVMLLRHALQDSDNKMFIFVSESCIPIQSFDKMYSALIRKTLCSWFYTYSRGKDSEAERRYSLLQPNQSILDFKNWRFATQFSAISRHHAKIIVSTFDKYANSVFPADNIPGAFDEYYFLSVLQQETGQRPPPNVFFKPITYSSFHCPIELGRPYEFAHINSKDISSITSSDCFFARKFSKSSNIDEYINMIWNSYDSIPRIFDDERDPTEMISSASTIQSIGNKIKDSELQIYTNPEVLVIGLADMNLIRNIYQDVPDVRFNIIYEGNNKKQLGVPRVESCVARDSQQIEDTIIKLRKMSKDYDVVVISPETKWNVYRTNMVIRMFCNAKIIICYYPILKAEKWEFVKSMHSNLEFNKYGDHLFIEKK